MFLGAVSGGLVALGLIATASRVGTAFYAFVLVLLPTLAFTGLMTFERVLQSGIEDLGYARRIALLRGYYFDEAPELIPYLLSVPTAASRPSPTTPARRRQTAPVRGPGVVARTVAGIPNGRGHDRGHHGRTFRLRRRSAHRQHLCSFSVGRARRRGNSGRRRAGRVDAASGISLETLRLDPEHHRSGWRRPGIRAEPFLRSVRAAPVPDRGQVRDP